MALSNTPTDIFYSVLEHITDRRDLYAAALINWDWNRAATPLLYRTLDTDTRARQRDHKSVCVLQYLPGPSVVLNPPLGKRCNSSCVHPPPQA